MPSDNAPLDATPPSEPAEPPFHRAARLGDIAEMERLLSSARINARCDLPGEHTLYDVTPLMVAAQSTEGANVDTLAWLLAHGADLHARSSNGGTAAWYCAGGGGHSRFPLESARSDYAERLRFLLDAGLSPEEYVANGTSLLTQACAAGDPERVRLLLERGLSPHPSEQSLQELGIAFPNEAETSLAAPPFPNGFYSFQIPLFCAAGSGSAECVDLLLQAGADLHLLDRHGRPVLANAGSPEVVQVLVAAGADPNEQYNERDVLGWVFSGGLQSHDLSEAERLDVAEALLEAGASRDSTAFSDWTQLYSAAFHHQADAVDFLLAQGASLRSTNSGTPLHGICWQGEYTDPETNLACERIIRALVAAGVPLDARRSEGNTALHEAAWGDWGNPTAVRVLLELGAQPDLVNDAGHTPLHLAAHAGFLASVTALLAAGADPARPDRDGDTPAEIARQNSRQWESIIARGGLGLSQAVRESKGEYEQKRLQEAKECVAVLEAATHSRV